MIEIVFVTTVAPDIAIQLIGAGEGADLFGVYGVGLTSSRHFAFAAGDGDDGGVALFVHIDFVSAGPENGKREIGRINFKGFVFADAPHANPDRTFGEAELEDIVGKVQERKAGASRKANRHRAKL